MSFVLDAKALLASIQVIERPLDPVSAVMTAARFLVDAARPGAVAG
jgi:hypothetical protein